MKYLNSIAAAGILIGLTGCASASKVVVLDRLGPCHTMEAATVSDGSLQVYSARTPAFSDLNAETYFWNNDYGKNEFVYGAGHTDYAIYQSDGKLFKRVRNSRGLNDDVPASVSLPTGSYAIQAEAEQYPGMTMTVVIPVAIQSGQITTVHLEPKWAPAGEEMDPTRLVRLADGRVLGCRVQSLVAQTTP
jgi:hypothetical protein